MTDDQRKKYEEAAKAHMIRPSGHSTFTRIRFDSFIAGCTFVSQDTEERLKELQDENKRLREALSDCLTLLKECSYDATEVTEKARKLLNL